MKNNGFTLIELMVVISIIGILAAIASISYQNFIIRSQVSEAMVLMSETRHRIQEYWEANGKLPEGNLQAGLGASGELNSKYVASTIVEDGLITTKMRDTGVSAMISGATITLRPIVEGREIRWECKVGTMALKYAPRNCQS